MTNNNDQKHETFESLIEKTLTEINNMLQNTMWDIAVDVKKGAIYTLVKNSREFFLRKFGCVYPFRVGLTERELLDILAGMDLVLTFKEGEKKEGEKS